MNYFRFCVYFSNLFYTRDIVTLQNPPLAPPKRGIYKFSLSITSPNISLSNLRYTIPPPIKKSINQTKLNVLGLIRFFKSISISLGDQTPICGSSFKVMQLLSKRQILLQRQFGILGYNFRSNLPYILQ